MLARAADRITLADVYHAVGEPQAFAMLPSTPDQQCFVGFGMSSVLRRIYQSLDDTIEAELDKITVA